MSPTLPFGHARAWRCWQARDVGCLFSCSGGCVRVADFVTGACRGRQLGHCICALFLQVRVCLVAWVTGQAWWRCGLPICARPSGGFRRQQRDGHAQDLVEPILWLLILRRTFWLESCWRVWLRLVLISRGSIRWQ